MALAAVCWLALSERRLSETQSAVDALRRRRAAVEEESRRLEKRISDFGSKDRPRDAAPKGPGSGAAPTAAGVKRGFDDKIGALVKSPQLQIEYLAAKRARLGRAYDSLFKSLNLSPDQIARFETIAMQREEQKLDIAGAVPAALRTSFSDGQWDTGSLTLSVGGPAGDADTQAAMQLMKQANQAFQNAATDLLGPDGYGQLNTYERAMPMRGVVDDLAGTLATSDNPLNSDQANQLTQVLANASASYAKGGAANLGQVDWGLVLQQAQSVLSPPQVSALAQAVSLRQSSTQLRTLILTATGAAGANPTPH